MQSLIGERDETDLGEVEMEGVLKNRIERRNQRLHHVIQKMAEADCEEDPERRALLVSGAALAVSTEVAREAMDHCRATRLFCDPC
jgi:hypothetical protein